MKIKGWRASYSTRPDAPTRLTYWDPHERMYCAVSYFCVKCRCPVSLEGTTDPWVLHGQKLLHQDQLSFLISSLWLLFSTMDPSSFLCFFSVLNLHDDMSHHHPQGQMSFFKPGVMLCSLINLHCPVLGWKVQGIQDFTIHFCVCVRCSHQSRHHFCPKPVTSRSTSEHCISDNVGHIHHDLNTPSKSWLLLTRQNTCGHHD